MKTRRIHNISSLLFPLMLLGCTSPDVEPPHPLSPVPTDRQLAWHEMEQYAFVHFSINTFTNKEWGYGDEDPAIFNPSHFDAGQWCRVFKDAGLKAVILTCKHHDGFCLWPSKFTEHSVKNSPWKNGQGDVVGEVHNACEEYGLKFGIYLSPWDRNRADYGKASYVQYYRDQLREIFTGYGPIFEMWFDGANGGTGYYGGANERRNIDKQTYYDWPTTLEIVRAMEPDVIFFSDAGPDIRWCGNEKGYVGETNWNTISTDTLYAGKSGITELLNTGTEGGDRWIPAEVDVSIRPGWFYHPEEDARVKTPEALFDIYLNSVGRGSNLLLNIPPDKHGLIHEQDVESLLGWKKLLDNAFGNNLALGKKTSADNIRGGLGKYGARNVTDGDKETYWATDDDVTRASLIIDLGKKKEINYIFVQEYIKLGQRVRRFDVEIEKDGQWEKVAASTTIGYKKILRLSPVSTSKVRINITGARACPLISNVEIY
jgi:alpha-L-fucosidase